MLKWRFIYWNGKPWVRRLLRNLGIKSVGLWPWRRRRRAWETFMKSFRCRSVTLTHWHWLVLTLDLQTEAGCRMVIDALLLHTALNLGSPEHGVAIIPEFRIDDTRLEPTLYTYGGVVDYMIIYTDRAARGMSSMHFAVSLSNIFQTLSHGLRSLPFCLMKSASSYRVAFTKQRQSQMLLC